MQCCLEHCYSVKAQTFALQAAADLSTTGVTANE
jgi:hypothetical protein